MKLSNKFVPFRTYYGLVLIHEKECEKYDLFPIDKMIAKLNLLGLDKDDLNYYMFRYGGTPRFFFVTKASLNFNASEQIWGMHTNGFLINGAIWDIEEERFIEIENGPFPYFEKANPKVDDFFYKFLIYDAGLPHIIKNKDDESYSILMLNEGAFSLIKSDSIPTCVTYVDDDVHDRITRKRLVFYTKRESNHYFRPLEEQFKLIPKLEEQSYVLALDFEINCVSLKNNVSFSHCVCGNNAPFGCKTYMYPCNHEEDFYLISPNNDDDFEEVEMFSYLIGGDAVIVTRSPNGMYGEMVLVFVDTRGITFDYSCSIDDYEIVEAKKPELKKHLIFKCSFKDKEYKNQVWFIDATDRVIYTKCP